VSSRPVLASSAKGIGQERIGDDEAGIGVELIERLEGKADCIGLSVGSGIEDSPPRVVEYQTGNLVTVYVFVVASNPNYMHRASLHDDVRQHRGNTSTYKVN